MRTEMRIEVPPIKLVSVEALHEDQKNPNFMSKDKFQALKENIKRYGFLVPVVTNKDLLIADGAHRWKAAKDLGIKEIPVVALDVSEVDRRILRQVMNKIKGEHKSDLDEEELRFILETQGEDPLKTLLAMDEKTVKNLSEGPIEIQEDKEFDVEKAKASPKYQVKRGEIYQLGPHTLMCGDSTVKDDLQALMQGEKAQMVFVDPPYNLAFAGTDKTFTKMQNDFLTEEAYTQFVTHLTTSMLNAAEESASFYICIDYRNHHKWINEIEQRKPLEHINTIVWDKVFAGIGYKYRFRHEFVIFAGDRKKLHWYGDTVQEDVFKLSKETRRKDAPITLDRKGFQVPINGGFLRLKLEDENAKRVPVVPVEKKEIIFRTEPQGDTDVFEGFSMNYFSQREAEHSDGIVHPTMKPLKLIAMAIKNSSRRNDIVLDLCGGSGSTLMAAEQLQRICRMMEIDERYCSVIMERYEALTGKAPERIK